MILLLKKLIILVSFCILTVLFLALGPGTYETELSKIMIEKKELLINSASPKIVLVGGSGLLYGIDSQLIKTELGVNVVNLGAYAGCGSEFYAQFVPNYVNTKDVVIFLPEYTQYQHQLKLSDETCRKWAFLTVFPGPTGFLYKNFKQRLADMVQLATSKVRGEFIALSNLMVRAEGPGSYDYFRSNFSGNGDKLAGFWHSPVLNGGERLAFDSMAISTIKNTVVNFKDKVDARKARFFVVPPAAARSWFVEQRSAIDLLFSNLNGVTVIGQPIDFSYDDALFQDTVNHLEEAGRYMRTEKLIALLKDNGVFHIRQGVSYTASGKISPEKYDLISGFHDDRTFTRGDATFYQLGYMLKPGRVSFVVTSKGWSPFKDDLKRLGLRAFIDGRELVFNKKIGLSYWFKIPKEVTSADDVRILSNTFRPVDLGMSDDGRRLGVDIQDITFRREEK